MPRVPEVPEVPRLPEVPEVPEVPSGALSASTDPQVPTHLRHPATSHPRHISHLKAPELGLSVFRRRTRDLVDDNDFERNPAPLKPEPETLDGFDVGYAGCWGG